MTWRQQAIKLGYRRVLFDLSICGGMPYRLGIYGYGNFSNLKESFLPACPGIYLMYASTTKDSYVGHAENMYEHQEELLKILLKGGGGRRLSNLRKKISDIREIRFLVLSICPTEKIPMAKAIAMQAIKPNLNGKLDDPYRIARYSDRQLIRSRILSFRKHFFCLYPNLRIA